MKIFFIVIITCSLIFDSYSQNSSNWQILNEGKGRFSLIDFVNDDVGWITDRDGKIMGTADGGETWETIFSDKNWSIRDLDFIDEMNGWTFFSYYSPSEETAYGIKKTVDGGQSWQTLKTWDEQLRGMFVVNDSVLFIWGNVIKKTVDGGRSWIDVTPSIDDIDITSLWFFNPDFGFVTQKSDSTNKNLLKTTNGGISWDEVPKPGFYDIRNLQFINDSTGYFLGYNEDYFPNLCKTTDTLNTWTIIIPVANLDSYFILDENTIFGVREDTVLSSKDGGITWGNKQSIGIGNLSRIYFSSPRFGYLLDKTYPIYTILWKSKDFGFTWERKIFSYSFKDVWFFNSNAGLIVGGDFLFAPHVGYNFGNFFLTDDGGMNWQNNLKAGSVESCFFINDETGFTVTTRGYESSIIKKTSDAGEHWLDVYNPNFDSTGYNFIGKDISFLNEELGWVIGRFHTVDGDSQGASILESRDRGENWTKVWTYLDTNNFRFNLNAIDASGSTAWAVGEYGMIVKYVEDDKWQLKTGITDLPLNDVFFIDELHGWIAGGYFNDENRYLILLKTTDGGESWEEIPDFNYKINDMYFADRLHGWVVGQDTSRKGLILETVDGGEKWDTVVGNLSGSLNAICFKDGVCWAVGGNGLILRTDNWVDWINSNTGEKYPAKYQLFQNYPNPFNPITNIEYRIPKSEHVELSIYNVLGQKIATLVNKKQPAGEYIVEWKASGFASGLYYYRLKTNKEHLTRKLLLLK
jgi:photosystem II stability/assembly factor-like uncharacterized protein